MRDRTAVVRLPERRSEAAGSVFTLEVGAVVLAGLAYYLGCLIGFASRFPVSGIAYLWPPNAILLVVLIRAQPRTWAAVLGAIFIAHGTAHTQDGVPPVAWMWQYAANCVQAVVAAIALRRFARRPPRFDTLRDVTVLVGGAALAAPAIASPLALPGYMEMAWARDYWSAWGLRTLTNFVTTITLVPPLLAIVGEGATMFGARRRSRVAEFMILLLGLGAAVWATHTLTQSAFGSLPWALSASLPFLVWAVGRFGAPGLSTCLLTVGYLAVAASASRSSPAGVLTLSTIVGVQLFVGIAGTPLMFLAVILGESRRFRQTQEALYHSEAKKAAILKAIPDLMFVQTKNPEYRYVEYYARDSHDLLVSPEKFLGRRMSDVLPPDLARSFEEVFRRAAASREPQVFEYSLPIGGAERRFEARAVECDDGQLLSIVRDITEQRNAAIALQKAEEGLARMSRASALGQLTASIAHEVHQPLNAITANAAACLRRLDEHDGDVSQIDEALLAILDDARRAAQVVKRTRGLFSGGPRVSALLDVNAEIGEVFVLMRHRPEARSGPILLELESGPLMVLGDRMQVQQVLMNLLVNASEAMSTVGNPERSISVRSWRAGAAIHVAVSDRGTGFDPDEIDRIFDAFYTTKSDGLGMGLAISRSIVHAHGGTLTARLNPDRGATFEFALPAVAEEARA